MGNLVFLTFISLSKYHHTAPTIKFQWTQKVLNWFMSEKLCLQILRKVLLYWSTQLYHWDSQLPVVTSASALAATPLILLRVQQPAGCMLIECEEYLWLVLSIFCCQLPFDTGQKGCQPKSWASLLCVSSLLAKDSYTERWFWTEKSQSNQENSSSGIYIACNFHTVSNGQT